MVSLARLSYVFSMLHIASLWSRDGRHGMRQSGIAPHVSGTTSCFFTAEPELHIDAASQRLLPYFTKTVLDAYQRTC